MLICFLAIVVYVYGRPDPKCIEMNIANGESCVRSYIICEVLNTDVGSFGL
jgi:hypothetical protein